MTGVHYEKLKENTATLNPPNALSFEEEIELVDHDSKSRQGTRVHKTNSEDKVMHLALGTLLLILLYLSLSIILTFYQKWLLKTIEFPLTIVLYHLMIKLMLSFGVRWMYKLTTGRSRVTLDYRTSFKKMAPTGMASGIDIGFSNWGLELVKISLYTMTKSTTIIFILFFAILLGLEKKSWSLILIVGMIAGGLLMFTYKSTSFDTVGFSFLLLASFTSGIRWSFAQLIMQKSKLGLHNPVDMIYYMQPWMILSILPFTLGFEGQRMFEIVNDLPNSSYEQVVFVFIKITIGAIIAFVMEISEFLVLSYTSSLTLSIAGIFKEICQLVLAVELNGDQLSMLNVLGLVLCLGGICCHIIHKYSLLMLPKKESVFDNVPSRASSNTAQCISKSTKGQNVPLLDANQMNNSDSDDGGENQNSSEVIFDVLKRRDTRR